ncbi:uracil-DNA glycosylase family protein [Herbiconiux moechotypicola]|uniref:Uracil-DNA glycosylase family protein n=1 Tax=Herbiconiux moechotypicola TaxID=637393 RepID=A0ABN3DLC2_9MICO|nr:uracil-DNA glycosylase family protein [Herbiconiux moechotypicola]MCS5730145.1 uracil-DNA glycosylase family protein [Herbiconiux moechotypicola]
MTETAEGTAFGRLRAEVAAHRSNAWATELGWEPLVVGSERSRMLIVSQAPGRRAQASGVPFDDASGALLRQWLGVSDEEFYDADRVAIVPMDFYYPGKAASGDAPPRPGFAELWHPQVLELLGDVRLTVLVGAYAQRRYLGAERGRTLTDTVREAGTRLPLFPIVHPSPLTRGWRVRNPWFEGETVPRLRGLVRDALEGAHGSA